MESFIKYGGLYRVQSGETLESICKKLKVNENYICALNQIDKEQIEKGDVLFISKTNYVYHIVKPMETLFSIAKQYNTSVEELKQKNNIEVLFVGQKLFI